MNSAQRPVRVFPTFGRLRPTAPSITSNDRALSKSSHTSADAGVSGPTVHGGGPYSSGQHVHSALEQARTRRSTGTPRGYTRAAGRQPLSSLRTATTRRPHEVKPKGAQAFPDGTCALRSRMAQPRSPSGVEVSGVRDSNVLPLRMQWRGAPLPMGPLARPV